MKPIIPERLKQARENAGLSVGQAAKIMNCARSWIELYESGQETPAPGELWRLSDAYDVSIAWLRGEEKPLVLPTDFAAFLDRMSPDERDSLIDLLSSMRQNES